MKRSFNMLLWLFIEACLIIGFFELLEPILSGTALYGGLSIMMWLIVTNFFLFEERTNKLNERVDTLEDKIKE